MSALPLTAAGGLLATCLPTGRLVAACRPPSGRLPARLLLGVDEAVGGGYVGDLHGAVAVGGEGDGVGLRGLRHGGGSRWGNGWMTKGREESWECRKLIMLQFGFCFQSF